jgi:hypothetical protein
MFNRTAVVSREAKRENNARHATCCWTMNALKEGINGYRKIHFSYRSPIHALVVRNDY